MHANAWFLYNLLPSTKHVWSLKKVQQFSQYLAGMLRVSQHQFRSCCRFKARVPSRIYMIYTQKALAKKTASRWSGYFQYSDNPVYFFEWLNPHLTWRCIKNIWRGYRYPNFIHRDLGQQYQRAANPQRFTSKPTLLGLWTFPTVVPNSKMNWDGVLTSRTGRSNTWV